MHCEILTGQITIGLSESLSFQAIEVTFQGLAYVHWEESSGSGENRTTNHYSGSEGYFKSHASIYGDGAPAGSNSNSLNAGQHVFPIQFQLPINLPSSFEAHTGHVRYSVEGKIRRSGIFSNYRTMTVFTVLDYLDLNEIPNAQIPVGAHDSKHLCCCCCRSGPVEADLQIDKAGFVPGEYVTAHASIENMSNSNMKATTISIMQSVTFRATTRSRTVPEVFDTIPHPGCSKRSNQQWNNVRLQIPALPPSGLRFCNIINIQYFVQLSAVTPTCHVNLNVLCPITIGSIPLQNATVNNAIGFSGDSERNSDRANTSTSIQASAPPPPTYTAATAVNVKTGENKDVMGEDTFAPQYAFYDWNQSAFQYNK
ncbi:unnamed protein product [Clavelina lepadiformis]|uniref:Arrestin C-terminal-like domain-containing protein n=1 Tax=Clavelina lepadiformis TaxID=159417 RepID=A0ABP0GKE8_CLALP